MTTISESFPIGSYTCAPYNLLCFDYLHVSWCWTEVAQLVPYNLMVLSKLQFTSTYVAPLIWYCVVSPVESQTRRVGGEECTIMYKKCTEINHDQLKPNLNLITIELDLTQARSTSWYTTSSTAVFTFIWLDDFSFCVVGQVLLCCEVFRWEDGFGPFWRLGEIYVVDEWEVTRERVYVYACREDKYDHKNVSIL